MREFMVAKMIYFMNKNFMKFVDKTGSQLALSPLLHPTLLPS